MTSSLPRKRSTTELLRLFALSLFEYHAFRSGALVFRPLSALCWSGRRGSNPPPIAWKAIALPNELLPPVEVWLSWGRVDSNHRTLPRTDLQSVAIAAMRLPRFPTNSFGSVGVRADEGTRTPDRLITNQLLYQLSYIGFVQTCQTTRFSLFEAAKILHFSNTAKVFFIFFALYILIH